MEIIRLRRWGKWVGLGAAIVLAITVLIAIALFVTVTLSNRELDERSVVTVKASKGNWEKGFDVNLVVHKFDTEQNELEVSYVVQAPNQLNLENPAPPQQDCLRLDVTDRSVNNIVAPKVYEFSCVAKAGNSYAYGETPRISIPAYQSVAMFPFDDIIAFPAARLDSRYIERQSDVTYAITKVFPGRVLELHGDSLNWELRFVRSFNEKAAILTGAALFFVIAALFAAGIWRQRANGCVRPENLLAIAGYIVSAVGFREFFHVSKLPSTSLFELVVFLAPLAFLCLLVLITILVPKPEAVAGSA